MQPVQITSFRSLNRIPGSHLQRCFTRSLLCQYTFNAVFRLMSLSALPISTLTQSNYRKRYQAVQSAKASEKSNGEALNNGFGSRSGGTPTSNKSFKRTPESNAALRGWFLWWRLLTQSLGVNAFAPVTRLSRMMSYCYNNYLTGSLYNYYVVGKPFQNESLCPFGSRFSWQRGEGKNILFDQIKGSFNSIREFVLASLLGTKSCPHPLSKFFTIQ